MPLLLVGVGSLIVAGLGAYAIHSVSSDAGQAVQQAGKGLSTAEAVVGAGIAVAVVVYAYKKAH